MSEEQQESGFRHLSRIYKAIEQAAFSSPWAKDPYVVLRHTKGSSKDNNLPTRHALRLLRKVDPSLHDLAAQLERVLSDSDLRRRLTANARRKVEDDFDLRKNTVRLGANGGITRD